MAALKLPGLASAVLVALLPADSIGGDLQNRQIVQALAGNTVFEAGSDYRPWRQYFADDGSTIYISGNRPATAGTWKAEGGNYCSIWPPSKQWVCYEFNIMETERRSEVVWKSPDGAVDRGIVVEGNLLHLKKPPVH